MSAINSTPWKISTITATGSINSLINLKLLYDIFEIDDNILYVEFGTNKSDTFSKGINPKIANRKRKKTKTIKRFDNQITVIISKIGDKDIKDQYKKTDVNVKIFKNGNIQMTGLKSEKQGEDIINFIIDKIQKYESQSDIVANPENVSLTKYKIQLINSDFRIDKIIIRDKLNKLINYEYGIDSSFEPCIYPGVKIKYMWRDDNVNNGVCKCEEECDCKKITIAVFQSGCIIITGAQKQLQIDEAYKYINNIFNTHYNDICNTK